MIVKLQDRIRFTILSNQPVNELSMNALGLLTWALLSKKKEYSRKIVMERFEIGDDLWKSISNELEQKGYLKRLNKTVLFSEVNGRFDSSYTLYKKEERPNDFTLISGEAHKELSIAALGVWRSFMTGRNYEYCKNTIQTKFNLSQSRTDKVWEELSDRGYRVGKNIHEISTMKGKKKTTERDVVNLIESENLFKELLAIWGLPVEPIYLVVKAKKSKWHKWPKEKQEEAIALLKSYPKNVMDQISKRTWLSGFINNDCLNRETLDMEAAKIKFQKPKGGTNSSIGKGLDHYLNDL